MSEERYAIIFQQSDGQHEEARGYDSRGTAGRAVCVLQGRRNPQIRMQR